MVLPDLSATRAGTLQLLVPVIAAVAGVVLLQEVVTLRLVLSATAILGGVAIAGWGRQTLASRP
jgi:drug/metabolite transporter (DMT)-like permease